MRSDRGLDWSAASEAAAIAPVRHFDDGVSQSGRERNHLFLAVEGRAFEDVSGLSGFDHPADGRALAVLDFDRDGWPDLAAVNANAPFLQLFRNQLGRGRAGAPPVVAVRLEGANRSPRPQPGSSSRDAVGARVEVEVGGARQVRVKRAGEGFAAQNSPRMLVGLGSHAQADVVRVRWPSGRVDTARDVAAGTELVFHEDAAHAPAGSSPVRTALRPTPGPPARAPEEPAVVGAGLAEGDESLRLLTTVASWCEACRHELPQLALLRDAFPDVGFYGVPVDEDDAPAKLDAWARANRPAYRLLSDLPEAERIAVQDHVRRSLRRDALPASVVTDGAGRVLETRWGAPTVSDLRRLLVRAHERR